LFAVGLIGARYLGKVSSGRIKEMEQLICKRRVDFALLSQI
jgi:hypothetical protein